ncbi:MAG: AarF/UbiB family protein [Polyangiaceae bacterium]|jgi:predicted unusual protein kinase regulating ubiquinone biosynthesis (AarF/ABC1/UbiB family)
MEIAPSGSTKVAVPVEMKDTHDLMVQAVRPENPPPALGSSAEASRASRALRKLPHRAASVGGWRFVRAYATTFAVISSYIGLSIRGRMFGRAWRDARVGEVHRRNARRVYATILTLQGLFIKVGQLLSIMANFLPEEFRVELEALQDQVPPRPYAEIAKCLEDELGERLAQITSFDREPIASASLGQVHAARLVDGRRVCLKVQHRDIDRIVRLDLATIRRIMKIVQWFVPVQGLDAYYRQIKSLLTQELDFALEADNIERIAKNFVSDDRVVFPEPIRGLCTRRVLTSTFVEGVKVGDMAALAALGVDKKDVARRLVRLYCQMIFVDGVYHADPHPGNLLVQRDGKIVLLDFGAVAELSPRMREGITEFLEGVLRRDTERLVQSLRKMGFISRTADERVGEKIVEYFHRRFQEEVRLESFNLKDIRIDPQRGLENLLDLRRMNIGLRELSGTFHVPQEWVLLERTLLLVYGCCSILDPDLNPVAIIQPYLSEYVLGNRDFAQIAVEAIRDMAMSAMTLPEDMRRYLMKANRGELEVRVRGLHEGATLIYTAARQMIYTAIGLFAGVEALESWRLHDRSLARELGAAAFVAFVLLLASSLFSRTRPR